MASELEELSDTFKRSSDIFILESGNPVFELSDIHITESGKSFLLPIPQEYRERLLENDPKFAFRDAIFFDGSQALEKISEITRIPDLHLRIADHSKKVAERFIWLQENNRLIFNGVTLGVYQIRRTRTGKEENSELRIQTYRSDFFTNRVMASIYAELRKEGHDVSKISKLEEIKSEKADYTPFLSQFAVSGFVLLHNDNTVVLGERSEFIMSEERKIHYSMNEGFTQTDFDEERPRIDKCFYRGLKEELNIDERLSSASPPKFLHIIFHRDKFEIGFTGVISIPKLPFEELKNYHKLASDGNVETYDLYAVDLTKKAVDEFMKAHEMTKGCELSFRFFLKQYFANNLEKPKPI